LGNRGIDEEDLAVLLGCSPEQIFRLALCRRPDIRTFRQDVERVAAYVGANALRLAEMLREVDAWTALQETTADSTLQPGSGLLMAARDREEPAEEADSDVPGTASDEKRDKDA
jgi:hypothetical protein